jgi:hypothetical protein
MLGQSVQAADDPKGIIDKAIKAVGGEDKLAKAKGFSWKAKGKIDFGGGNGGEFTSESTVEGLDHFYSKFSGEFGGNKIEGVVVLAGDKGWRSFMGMTMDLEGDALANEKRNLHLQVLPFMLLPLKDKGYKLESAKEENVDGKPAVGVKVTGPDGKDFTLYFDNQSGLPVRVVAKVTGFNGDEFTQDTTLTGYKDFDGIKKSTKSSSKRDGQNFVDVEVTEFKVLDKVDPKTFAKPE